MSARKDFETKVQEDENTDSGFLSGPMSEQLLSEDLSVPEESENKDDEIQDTSDVMCSQELDSGLCLSECLSSMKLSDSTPTAQQLPTITVNEEKPLDVPPLAILFQQDDDGDTQLHVAAVHGCQRSVSTLIRVCPNKMFLDVPNDYGHTALHLAVLSDHAVVTRMLVRAGASIGIRDLAGETPIHIAASRNKVDCLQALLAPVPEHPPRKLSTVLNQKNYNGQSCVHLSASAGHMEALQTLVYYGADVNASEGLAGWTALHIAARLGNEALCKFLVERCPAASALARDFSGRTPKRLAAKNKAARAFASVAWDSGDETDSDDDYDSDTETLFEKLRDNLNPINVA